MLQWRQFIFGICDQGRNFNKFFGWWGVRGFPANIFCPCHFLFSNSSSPMVLGPVSCPADVHCTTIFPLRNGKFSRFGMSHPYTLLSFVPACNCIFDSGVSKGDLLLVLETLHVCGHAQVRSHVSPGTYILTRHPISNYIY